MGMSCSSAKKGSRYPPIGRTTQVRTRVSRECENGGTTSKKFEWREGGEVAIVAIAFNNVQQARCC